MALTKWALHPTHSEVRFKVKHLMNSYVTGGFKQFDAIIELEEDVISTAKILFVADVDSLSTKNYQRDVRLKASDFLDAENHPQLIFISTGMQKIDNENYKLYGTLTMRGVSKDETLDVEFGGFMKDLWGSHLPVFSIKSKIKRKDYGLSFSILSDTGNILLGDEILINAQVQFIKVVTPSEKESIT